jgi:hypothetical protein
LNEVAASAVVGSESEQSDIRELVRQLKAMNISSLEEIKWNVIDLALSQSHNSLNLIRESFEDKKLATKMEPTIRAGQDFLYLAT